jgi:dsDNA-specific endonuclease/ATPase MutS2
LKKKFGVISLEFGEGKIQEVTKPLLPMGFWMARRGFYETIILNSELRTPNFGTEPMTPNSELELDAVQIPIEDWIDLHTFSPKEILLLLEDYLLECQKMGFREVRIIHGKGKGVQMRIVHSFLKKSPLVESFRPAQPEAGGWGATIACLLLRPTSRS